MTRPTPTRPAGSVRRGIPVLLFLLVTLGFVAVVLGGRLPWFDRSVRYVVTADDVTGVEVGVPVTLAGYPVGRVRGVRAVGWTPPRFEIDVALEPEVALAEGTRAEIEPGLVGGNGSVRLLPGTGAERLAAGATLVGGRVDSLPERAGRTLANVDHTLQRSGTSFDKLDRALDATTGAATEIRAGAAEGRALLGAVGPDLERGAARLVTALDAATTASGRAEALLAEDGELVHTLQATRTELAAAGELMADFDPERSAFMADTLTELNTLLAESAQLSTRFREQKLLMLVKRDAAPDAAPAVGAPD